MHTNTVIATLWLLAALSRLIAAAGGSMPPSSDDADVDADDDPAPAPFEDEETTTVTTITTTLTRTVTLIQVAAAASTAPDEMSIGAKEYRLQGCFARQDGVGAVLGTDFIIPAVPVASADVDVDVNTGSDMSLSLCLKLCAGTVGRGNETYPYVGVSGGESCYCGTTLSPTAPRASAEGCTLPCAGNNAEGCGGADSISVYKLTSDAIPNPHSKFAAGGTTISENDTDTDRRHPGVMAGVALGSIAGFGLAAFLLFLAARSYTRRRQRRRETTTTTTSATTADTTGNKNRIEISRRSSSSSTDTDTDTADHSGRGLREHPVVREATRIDLRRLDGVVMDSHLPSPRTSTRGARASAGAVALASTATGAEWRAGVGGEGSPLTPRTPRHVADVDGGGGGREKQGSSSSSSSSSTPSILVHPPDNVAPTHGLGERAWHRRRLSMVFPPDGAALGRGEGAAGDGEEHRDGEENRESVLPSQGTAQVRASARFGAAGGEDDAVSALSEAGTASSPSWRWTVSTVSPAGERASGEVRRELGAEEKGSGKGE